jgi:tRNA (guanine6-N2)-methyltransferase
VGVVVRALKTARPRDETIRPRRPPPRPRRANPEPPKPFKFGAHIYLAQTQPGFEPIAANEIAARYDRNRTVELGRRMVPERVGMTIFSAPRIDPLKLVRTAEDFFAVIAYRRFPVSPLDPALKYVPKSAAEHDADERLASKTLERVRTASRDARFIEEALAAHVNLVPGSRAGKRLYYRVIARMAGEHPFRRVDLQRAVERGIGERDDHSWLPGGDDADVEFWATMFPGEFILTLRLSDERLRHRDYKVAHMHGSLRPSVAAALGWLSEPASDDIVLDPMCGAGTVLIERAHLGRYQQLIGGDSDRVSLAAARENVGPRYKPIEFHLWDATSIGLETASVTKVISNLPWGMRHGSHAENRRLYPSLIEEFRRVVRPRGLIVMLTAETHLMADLMSRGVFRPQKILRVSILGAPAAIYVVRAA